MAQEVDCPSCGKGVNVAARAPAMLACPHCGASFVPKGAATVVLQIQTDGGHLKDLGTISLTPEFRGRWLLGKLLGRGAMGMVFEAHDLQGGNPVAIKFLTAVDDNAVLQRFLREGKITLAIDHPNVVRVYELAEMQGHPYLITELMTGGTLRGRLNREAKLSIEDTIRISRDCLLGLGAVHALGIVHRDMKPENILFAADGTAKIADFGIAKDQTNQEKMTQTGQLLGTPQYISPEQIKNSGITRAADIYSTGVLMYEMLAGKPPFASSDVFNLLMQQVSKTPPHLKDARPDVPDDLAALIHRCLAKDAAQRPPAAEQVATALQLSGEAYQLRASGQITVSEVAPELVDDLPPPPGPSRAPLVIAALLLLGMGAAAVGTRYLKRLLPAVVESADPSASPGVPSPASGAPRADPAESPAPSPSEPATPSAAPSANPSVTEAPSPDASPAEPSPSAAAPASPEASPTSPASPGTPASPGASPSPSPSARPATPSPASSASPDALALSGAPRTAELAAALWGEGLQYEAIELLRPVVASNPGDQRTALKLVSYLLNAGRAPEAAAILEGLLREHPTLRSLKLLLADAQEESAKLDAAEAIYKALLGLNPNDLEAQSGVGSVKRRRGTTQDAERALGAVLRVDARNPAAMYQMGLLRRNMGRAQEAERYLRAAVAARRDHAAAHAALAQLLEELGRVQEAEPWYFAAARLDARYTPAPARAAPLLTRLGKHKEAEEQYRRALAAEPDNVPLRKALVDSLSAQARRVDAVVHAQVVAAIENKRVEKLHNLAVQMGDEKRYGEALACFVAAHKLAPKQPQILANLGTVLTRQGRWIEAIDRFNQALQLDPGNETYTKYLDSAMRVVETMRMNGTR